MKRYRYASVVLLLLAIPACGHVGQRFLVFQIELDGQVVLEGMQGVSDIMPVDEMWDVLGKVPFSAKEGQTPPDELEGDVVVRITHVNKELASAKLKTLSLQPDAAGSNWSLSAAEAERVKRAAAD